MASTVLGGFVQAEAMAHGRQSGLRFLSLIVGGVGLLVTALLAWSGAARPACMADSAPAMPQPSTR